eukprot:TRINITY_DN3444_c0_g2_i3.p1 TRINITY_DN3444_c0_g2~~TRINITY_DN3444_c0_g2_i3.p1  ORF type:complete len:269 (-),score=36.57 TRINITY_DN3444_c0_g2_i3:107-913(-)
MILNDSEKVGSDSKPIIPRYFKISLIIFNCILWCLGAILVVLGDFTWDTLGVVRSQLLSNNLPLIVLAFGIFLFVSAFVGGFIAYRGYLRRTILHSVFVLLICVVLIGVGGDLYSYNRAKSTNQLSKAWENAPDISRQTLEKSFVSQGKFCCGWGKLSDGSVAYPSSFCLNSSETERNSRPSCSNLIIDFVDEKLYNLAVVAITSGVVGFVLMVISLRLSINIHTHPKYVHGNFTSLEDELPVEANDPRNTDVVFPSFPIPGFPFIDK